MTCRIEKGVPGYLPQTPEAASVASVDTARFGRLIVSISGKYVQSSLAFDNCLLLFPFFSLSNSPGPWFVTVNGTDL